MAKEFPPVKVQAIAAEVTALLKENKETVSVAETVDPSLRFTESYMTIRLGGACLISFTTKEQDVQFAYFWSVHWGFANLSRCRLPVALSQLRFLAPQGRATFTKVV